MPADKSNANHSSGQNRKSLSLSLAAFFFFACLLVVGCFFGDENNGLLVDLEVINQPPLSVNHWLGTDSLGRDVLTTAILGARTSLLVGLTAASLAIGFGTVWGAASALSGRLIGDLMMRLVDALLSIPSLILLLALTSLINSPDFARQLPAWAESFFGISSYSLGFLPVVSVIAVIAATSWLESARIAHAKISAIRLEEYIEAARSLGASKFQILVGHLLPNARRIMLIQATLLISDAIVMEAGLSFLGLGLGPSTPSWGSMLRQAGSDMFFGNWWAPLVPAILISLSVLAVNLFGESMLALSGEAEKPH